MMEVGRQITPVMHDELGLMLEESGIMNPKEFARIPTGTKDKILKCMAILASLPDDDFATAEVKTIVKEQLGIGDFQRFILMLTQGGFLSREASGAGRSFLYRKTEAARLPEPHLAKALFEANSLMYGYQERKEEGQGTREGRRSWKAQGQEEESLLRAQEQLDLQGESESVPASMADAEGAFPKLKYQFKLLQAENEMLKRQLEQVRKGNPALVKLSKDFLELEQSFTKARIAFPGMTLEMFLEFWLKTRKGSGRE
jgi:hypothetical protein